MDPAGRLEHAGELTDAEESTVDSLTAEALLSAGRLLYIRYERREDDDPLRLADLNACIDQLRRASNAPDLVDLPAEMVLDINALLGLALADRVDDAGVDAPTRADDIAEAITRLQDALYQLDHERRETYLVAEALIRVLMVRYVARRFVAEDVRLDALDLAIDLLWGMARRDDGAAWELANALYFRHHVTRQPEDRDEAIRLLERVCANPDFAGADRECADMLGDYYLDLVDERGTDEDVDKAVRFLERMIQAGYDEYEDLTMMLGELYTKHDRLRSANPDRLIELVITARSGERFGELWVDGWLGEAYAERAMHTGSRADAEAAFALVARAARSVGPEVEDGLEYLVVAATLATGEWPPWPMSPLDVVPDIATCELFKGWLATWVGRVGEGEPELLTAIALLDCAVVENQGEPTVEGHRRVVTSLLAAQAALPAEDDLRLFVEYELGLKMTELAFARACTDEMASAIEVLAAAVEAIPTGHRLRSTACLMLGLSVVNAREHGRSVGDLRSAADVLAEAAADADFDVAKRALALMTLGQAEGVLWLDNQGDIATGLRYCEQAAELVPPDSFVQRDVRLSIGILLTHRFRVIGDMRDHQTATALLTGLRADIEQHGPGMVAKVESVDVYLRQLTALAQPVDHDALAGLGLLINPDAVPADLVKLATHAKPGSYSRPMLCVAAGLALTRTARTKSEWDEALWWLATGANDPGVIERDSGRFIAACGMAWAARYRKLGDLEARRTAIRQLERAKAVQLAGGNVHGIDTVLDSLADLYWESGQLDRSIAATKEALTWQAREVLLQNGPAAARTRAAPAATRAALAVARCLAHDQQDEAVRILEMGRGLMLHAATTRADIAALLIDRGHPELAAEWQTETSGSDVPSQLRFRVLSALEDVIDRLIEPPSVDEIGAGLRSVHADALVYLLPPVGDDPARAVFVSAEGRVSQVILQGVADPWEDVLRPVLQHVQPRPYLVLVPSGELGVVPWHAAVAKDGRYALQQAMFSYASSARQLCTVASRTRLPIARDPVIVTDPTRELAGATLVEVEYLHRIYPHGTFLGGATESVPVAGPGTPAEILAHLGASLLHLGCHGESSATPTESHLLLADHSRLTVEAILRHAAGRDPTAPGGTVVLAACQSDITDAEHDEALTLATAFLAAGATSVVGTKWPVDDLPAARLICVFHDHLRQGLRPVEALHATQLWALDGPAEVRDVRVWGAVVHRGQ